MQVAKDKVVSIDYTLTNARGEVLDSSEGGAPLPYLHGSGNIIPGLETALEGKDEGERVTASIPPEQAYGPRNEELVQSVPRDRFEGVENIAPGMEFQAKTEAGVHPVKVVAVDDDSVTVDANHALAGETLNFDIQIVEVRDATEEELAHGHVHGPGGHEH